MQPTLESIRWTLPMTQNHSSEWQGKLKIMHSHFVSSTETPGMTKSDPSEQHFYSCDDTDPSEQKRDTRRNRNHPHWMAMEQFRCCWLNWVSSGKKLGNTWIHSSEIKWDTWDDVEQLRGRETPRMTESHTVSGSGTPGMTQSHPRECQ